MSDDIDRLKTMLDGIAQTSDEMRDIHDAMRDVVNAVTPVDRSSDPEGHGALRDIAGDIKLAYTQLHQRFGDLGAQVWHLQEKAGLT